MKEEYSCPFRMVMDGKNLFSFLSREHIHDILLPLPLSTGGEALGFYLCSATPTATTAGTPGLTKVPP